MLKNPTFSPPRPPSHVFMTRSWTCKAENGVTNKRKNSSAADMRDKGSLTK